MQRTVAPAVITVHIVSEACGTRDPPVASLTKAGGAVALGRSGEARKTASPKYFMTNHRTRN